MGHTDFVSFLKDWRNAEASNRHSAAIFLIIYSLVGMDIMSVQDEKQRQKITAKWVAWGVVFTLIGFFIISPEQEAIQKKLERKQTSSY